MANPRVLAGLPIIGTEKSACRPEDVQLQAVASALSHWRRPLNLVVPLGRGKLGGSSYDSREQLYTENGKRFSEAQVPISLQLL
jgi:hypothetical protein